VGQRFVPSEEVISDVLKVKAERKPAINKRKKGARV
jgi:hypothetical protein